MTVIDKIKQLWISLRLEKNPYYYYVIDIQDTINKLHHIMTGQKLSRPNMKSAALYISLLRDYKRMISVKSGRVDVHEMQNIINEVQLVLTSVSKFMQKVNNNND